MTSSSIEVSEIQGHLSPEAQEAAVRYANGRYAEAAALLADAIAEPRAGQDMQMMWLMLFELHRLQGHWAEFDELTRRYTATFDKPAPLWVVDDTLGEHLPAELRRGGPAYCEIAGELGKGSQTQLAAVGKAAAEHSVVHLDLTKITAVSPEGCELFSLELQFLITNGNGVQFSGAEQLEKLLRQAADAQPKVAPVWRLLLDLYQLQGRQHPYESAALEYALYVEVEPPVWEALLMPVLPQADTDERRDEPRYSAGPEMIYLQGEMLGANDPQLDEVRQFARDRDFVNVNLSRLSRIDFVCAANLGNTVSALCDLGKTVRLIKPNLLVATLLKMLKVDELAAIIVAKPAT
jgi:ABC-type transporter Mla MlaB component